MDAFEDACGNWQKAASMGHNTASLQSNKYCKDIAANKPNSGPRPRPGAGTTTGSSESKPTQTSPIPTKPGTSTSTTPSTKPTRPGTGGTDTSTQIPSTSDDVVVIEKPTQPMDNSVNEIFVDEDLTLVIKNGLGGRTLLQQPNILILADEGGVVAIDVVVNERGRVDSAEVNAGASTLKTQSIVSLALRKAKEFWFEKSDWPETNGTIVFKISGR